MRQPAVAFVLMHDRAGGYGRDAVAHNQRSGSIPVTLCDQGIELQNLGIRVGAK
ncbi:MAG TPA: hypothetical protein VEU11_03585 [Terriglobales bacterium]|nr:hypothetical protein [Terriglobales bacterium]